MLGSPITIKGTLRRKIGRFLSHSIQWGRIALYRVLSTNDIIGLPHYFQPAQCAGKGSIVAGKGVSIGVSSSPLFFSTYAYIEARSERSSISIGEGTWINNNFCAIADHTSISIGINCLIGCSVEILDSDFHGARINERKLSKPEWAKPVNIGNNVFIGSNARILKGVSIGDGAVIANSSVVTKDIPPNVVAAGNPARPIRLIE